MSARLLSTLEAQWATLDGYAAAQNLPNLQEMDLSRLCNFVYWYVTKDAAKESIDKYNAQLWMPPKGIEPDERSPWSPENEAKAFSALSASLGKRTTAPKPGA